jgi:oligoendopeptidase F
MTATNENFPTSNPSWDLESLFAGGADSPSFFETVDVLGGQLGALTESARRLPRPDAEGFGSVGERSWTAFFADLDVFRRQFRDCGVFAVGMASAHADDPAAVRLPSVLNNLSTSYETLYVIVKTHLRGLTDEAFARLHDAPGLADASLMLRELRRDADQAMEPALEMLAVQLNRDGLNAWAQFYREFTGRLDVEVEDERGQLKRMSVGQAKNLHEHPDREMRRRAFEGLERAWSEAAPVCASTLNSIIGAEQTLYRNRGCDELTGALHSNRVERASIEAMHEAARRLQPELVTYMQIKARRLGLERLQWYDLHAPLTTASGTTMCYEDAQRFIVTQVEEFSSEMAQFCRHALANQWVEVEDRPGKGQGGYCATLPGRKEVRIFMTFGGTSSGVTTLAHELGHGYHAWVMRDLPGSQTRVPMGLAETASTLLEALVEDAALRKAEGEEKLDLLDKRLGRAVAFLMDVPARYELELALHRERARGPLHDPLLRRLTREIFEAKFGEGLASVDELFWAAKLHFYLASVPFYNFPYTFGYLFSRAVYARARTQGPEFIPVIDELLRDTGRLSSEEIAAQYLGGDLRDPEFWYQAAASIKDDVATYRKLIEG